MGPYEKLPVPLAFRALRTTLGVTWAEPLLRCLQSTADDPTSRYAAIASVDAQGAPRVRHVVMRGCAGDFERYDEGRSPIAFWMVTDRRSAKYEEFALRPFAEIVWYFREPREQFRFSGSVRLIDSPESDFRRQAFSALSPAARVQFHWPEPRLPRRPERDVEYQISQDPGLPIDPPGSFVTLIIEVRAADHLILNGTPQNRWLHDLDESGEWRAFEVNP